MNQPRAPRVVVKAPVSFEGRQGVGRGTTFNLSLGGCGFESTAEVSMDSTMKINLHIPKPCTSPSRSLDIDRILVL